MTIMRTDKGIVICAETGTTLYLGKNIGNREPRRWLLNAHGKRVGYTKYSTKAPSVWVGNFQLDGTPL